MKPMTSYAQNFEDVMLSRALSGVDVGFYIDVGAQDPVADSVTRAFYVRGWRGINIDPVKHWHQRLMEDRPHDINLRVAVGATQGRIRVHEVAESGLSTTSDEYAARHEGAGFIVSSEMVEMTTLDAIMAEQRVREVHFLKIDVEGAEKDVLTGISFHEVRPWIVLVESREPNSRVTTHDAWEHLLLDAQYTFVYDDGLNRFYVADEHAELSASFELPPNVFDNFTSWSDPSAEVALALCKEGARLTQARLEEVDADRAALTLSLAAVRSDRDGLAKWAGELDIQAAESVARTEALMERLGRLESESENLKSELRRAVESGAAATSQLLAERDEVSSRLASVTADRDGLVKWAGQLQAEATGLGVRVEELQAQLALARTLHDAHVAELRTRNETTVAAHLVEAREDRDRFERLHDAERRHGKVLEDRLLRTEIENERLAALALRASDEIGSLRDWLENEYQARLRQQALVHESSINALNARLRDANQDAHVIKAQLATLVSSRSWRITAPLRVIARLVRYGTLRGRATIATDSSSKEIALEGEAGQVLEVLRVKHPEDALTEKRVASLDRLSDLIRRRSL